MNTIKQGSSIKTNSGRRTYQDLGELYKEKARLDLIKMKQMLSDDYYMDWLERFTNKKNSFNSYDSANSGKDSFKIDEENIKNLHLLFSGINRYCRDKEIYPKLDDSGSYYLLQYNYIGYQIGYKANRYVGTYYCNRMHTIVDETYINFKDIKRFIKEGNFSEQKPKQTKKSISLQKRKQ